MKFTTSVAVLALALGAAAQGASSSASGSASVSASHSSAAPSGSTKPKNNAFVSTIGMEGVVAYVAAGAAAAVFL